MIHSNGKQARNFAIVGSIGFIVDGGFLTMLNGVFEFELLPSRLASFSAAVTITWFLNRRNTFADRKDSRAAREWGRYVVVNSIGAVLNMGIFFSLVYHYSSFAKMPLVPLAMASSIALVFNFFASKHIAFRHQQV